MTPFEPELSGTQLIEASAGTGKTHAITTLFLRLLLERGLTVDRILVVTYTNAATAELRDRIRSRIAAAALACGRPTILPDAERDLRELLARRSAEADLDREALALALRSFDEASILTIHSFCQRVLQEHAFECGASFDVELLTDELALREEILRDFWITRLADADEAFVRYLDAEGVVPSRLASLVRKTLGNPDLRVVPEATSAGDAPDAEAWQEARDAVCAAWAEDREAVNRLLEESDGLLRRFYPRDSIRGWTDRLDAALAVPLPAVSLRFPLLERLTTAGLESGRKKNGVAPRHPFFERCTRLWEAEAPYRAGFPRRRIALELDLVRFAREEAARRKERRGCVSFDDLLRRVRDALGGPRGGELAAAVRRRFEAALIDEFQDTDPLQWRIFRSIWGDAGRPLFLIGDPKQAIYGFRGADVFTFLDGKHAASVVHSLGVNWRSDPGLLDALNYFFERTDHPFLVPGIDYEPVEPAPGARDAFGAPGEMTAPLRILLFPGDGFRGARGAVSVSRAEPWIPRVVAGEIVRLLEAGLAIPDRKGNHVRPLVPGDVAVLCRTNAQARDVQTALADLGVPGVLQGDRSVFESDEAKDLLAVLQAMADPTDPRLLRAALATSLLGATAERIAALDADESLWDEEAARFSAWNEEWATRGFMRAFRRMLGERGVMARLVALPRGERRLTNVLHLAELLHAAAVTGHRGPQELMDWCRRQIEEGHRGGEMAPEELQIRLESDADAVTLTTIHKAKGLEWPIVLCPYLWRKSELWGDDAKRIRFHGDDGAPTLDLGSDRFDEHWRRADHERRAEDVRLLYVALTRARHQCSILWGGFGEATKSPLAPFLGASAELESDDRTARALEAIAAGSGGRIAVRRLPLDPPSRWRGASEPARTLACRELARTLDEPWRISSFTALAAARDARVSRLGEEGRDHDEGTAPAAPHADEVTAAGRLPLAEFPAGARPGLLVHEILERIDFACSDPEELGRVIDGRLRAYGMDGSWRGPLEQAIAGLLVAPIGAGGAVVRLADVGRDARLSEMEFTLPIGAGGGASALAPGELAGVFARHPPPGAPADYPERLRTLGFAPLAGALRGYVDLVFRHGGRFFLVDWKSNHLGRSPADYAPERLGTVMARHHYYLQYHLYVATLDRHLRRRLEGYDYDAHFGGVLYLFVRGVLAGGDGRTGVFFHRPAAALVADLSARLADPGTAR